MSGDSLVSGIFIKNIIADSSADKCGLLRVGDRILGNFSSFKIFQSFFKSLKCFFLSAVDGIDIRQVSSHEVAVKTIKNASDKMTLRVQSLNTAVRNWILRLKSQKFFIHVVIFNSERRWESNWIYETNTASRDACENSNSGNNSSMKHIGKFYYLLTQF